MAKSIPSRIESIRRSVESQTAQPIDVVVDLVTAETREEALALLALPPTPPPNAARVRIVTEHHQAADYLAALGVNLPTLPE